MTAPHEKWLDEFQGKVPHGTRYAKSELYEREHYHARSPWEEAAINKETNREAAEITRRTLFETDLIRQQQEENRCAMN